MTTMFATFTDAHPATQVNERLSFDCLEPLQLIQLEWSFRQWVKMTSDYETRLTRQRILILFLLFRYCGVTLRETLALDLETDLKAHSILIRHLDAPSVMAREIPLVEHIAREIRESLQNLDISSGFVEAEVLTPMVVQHAFAQRAKACAFPAILCNPEEIRLARAMELQREGYSPKKIRQWLGDLRSTSTAMHCTQAPLCTRSTPSTLP